MEVCLICVTSVQKFTLWELALTHRSRFCVDLELLWINSAQVQEEGHLTFPRRIPVDLS